ncbi:MAG: alpha/beta fold hydrolase [Acidobacteriota bacterium]|nr:alpha/beta fold hydrolase [Acidobacteriota bacterium]
MAASSHRSSRTGRRRRRLTRTLLWGSAAIGAPALANALIARRNCELEAATWGRSRRYSWRHGEIAFQQLGEGEPVVLIHSLGPGHDAEEWRDASLALSRQRCIFAPDLLGWGHSDKPAIRYDGELYIQLLRDFIEEVVRERTALVGAGLAAAYAIQTAADSPQLVTCLGLSTPLGLEAHNDEPDLADALTNRALRLPLVGTSALNLHTSRPALSRHLRREVFASADRVDATRIEHYYRSSHQPGSHLALAAHLSGYLNHQVEPSLARLDVPIWMAWGRDGNAPAVETADLWLNRLHGAQLDVFEGVGSLPHLEAPHTFAGKLESFLDRVVS